MEVQVEQISLRQALEKKRELFYKIRADQCKRRFYEFFQEFWEFVSSDDLELNWHIEVVCDELQEVGLRIAHRETSPYDLYINIPPGSSKSTMVSILFPVWLWLHRPDIVVVSSSYSSPLSIDHSLKSKAVFKSERFQKYYGNYFKKEFGYFLYLTKDTEQDWRNNYGGGRFATSTGGSVTGKHADIIIRDDSLNPEQAESDAERVRCNRFNDRTLSSRKKKKDVACTITVMQRLHEDDPTGHDIAKKKKKPIRLISLPAEITEKTKPVPIELADKYVNGLLDPSRFTREILDEALSDLGSYGYAGQYLQNPVPEGGGKIKEEWIKKAHPNTIYESIQWFMYIDGAYTENTANDPTGIMICGIWKNKLVIRFCTSQYLEINELIEQVKMIIVVNKLLKSIPVYIEPKASGKTIKQLLTKIGYNAIEIASWLVGENKAGRINLCVPYAEAGRIELVEGAWNGEFIHQITQFPKANHDEYVDLLGYAVDRHLHNSESYEKKDEVNPSEFY